MKLIVLHKSAAVDKPTKPVICPKCERGVLGHILEESKAVLSKRGKPPPEKQGDSVQVKCHVCHTYWKMTIE